MHIFIRTAYSKLFTQNIRQKGKYMLYDRTSPQKCKQFPNLFRIIALNPSENARNEKILILHIFESFFAHHVILLIGDNLYSIQPVRNFLIKLNKI